jgi:MFS family permease
MLASFGTGRALGSLIFARVIYALNWMNLGAIFFLMSPDLGSGVSGLGTLSATFYLGIGIFQVPAGLLAAKWGLKRVVVVGVFVSSICALGTSAMTTVLQIAVLRFFVGVGMAFVFAPGIVLVAGLLKGGKSGMGVGLFNSAFDLGGLLALFGWVLVATLTGWRLSLAISGGLGVLTGVLTLLFVPGDRPKEKPAMGTVQLLKVMKDKQLVLVGLGTIGFDIGNTIISGFMIFYLVSVHAASQTVAGLVASLVTVVPIFASLWAGRIFDATGRHRLMMSLSVLASAGALAFGAYPTVYAAVACSAIGGVAAGVGYTFTFAGARELNPAGKAYETLSISWVNSIHLTGSFIAPVFFSLVVESLGYSEAWLWSGALTLAFLAPILMMTERWGR